MKNDICILNLMFFANQNMTEEPSAMSNRPSYLPVTLGQINFILHFNKNGISDLFSLRHQTLRLSTC